MEISTRQMKKRTYLQIGVIWIGYTTLFFRWSIYSKSRISSPSWPWWNIDERRIVEMWDFIYI